MIETVYEVLRPIKTRTVLHRGPQYDDNGPDPVANEGKPQTQTAGLSHRGSSDGNVHPAQHTGAAGKHKADTHLDLLKSPPVDATSNPFASPYTQGLAQGHTVFSARSANYTQAAVPMLPEHIPMQTVSTASVSPVPPHADSPKGLMGPEYYGKVLSSGSAANGNHRRLASTSDEVPAPGVPTLVLGRGAAAGGRSFVNNDEQQLSGRSDEQEFVDEDDEYEDMDEDDDDDDEHNMEYNQTLPLTPLISYAIPAAGGKPSEGSPRVEASNPMMAKFQAQARARNAAGGSGVTGANPLSRQPKPSVFFPDDDTVTRTIAESQQKQPKSGSRMASLSALGSLTSNTDTSSSVNATTSSTGAVALGRVPPAPRDMLKMIGRGSEDSDEGEFQDNDDDDEDDDVDNALTSMANDYKRDPKESIAASGLSGPLPTHSQREQYSPKSSPSGASSANPFSAVTLSASASKSFGSRSEDALAAGLPTVTLTDLKKSAVASASEVSPGGTALSPPLSNPRNPSVLQRKASFEMRRPLMMQNSADVDESLAAVLQQAGDFKPTVPQAPPVFLPPRSPMHSDGGGSPSDRDASKSPTHLRTVKVGGVRVGSSSSLTSGSSTAVSRDSSTDTLDSSGRLSNKSMGKKVSFWQELDAKQSGTGGSSSKPAESN
jgi:hypothetical protein